MAGIDRNGGERMYGWRDRCDGGREVVGPMEVMDG